MVTKDLKVAPRVEKTEAIKKIKFCKSDLFCKLHNGKTLFSIMNSLFSLFLPRSYFLQR